MTFPTTLLIQHCCDLYFQAIGPAETQNGELVTRQQYGNCVMGLGCETAKICSLTMLMYPIPFLNTQDFGLLSFFFYISLCRETIIQQKSVLLVYKHGIVMQMINMHLFQVSSPCIRSE